MSREDSGDLLDLLDVDDILETIGDGDDGIGVAVAEATVGESAAGGSAGDAQEVSEQRTGLDATVNEQDPVEQEEQQSEEKEEQHDDRSTKGGRTQQKPLEVDIDTTTLNMQQGYDCFRELEKRRAEERKQLQQEEEDMEKSKATYSGKRWAVKQPPGPMRPQDAGELAVTCAIKAGNEKMSPREEIEELTRKDEEKKKKEKELAEAAKPKPVIRKPSLRMPVVHRTGDEGEAPKDGKAASTNAAHDENAVSGGKEKQEEEACNGKVEEEKRGETADANKNRSEQEDAGSAGALEAPSVHTPALDGKHEGAESPGKSHGLKPKLKLFQGFTCSGKKGNVRLPQKALDKKCITTKEAGEDGSTGDYDDTKHAYRQAVTLNRPAHGVFED